MYSGFCLENVDYLDLAAVKFNLLNHKTKRSPVVDIEELFTLQCML